MIIRKINRTTLLFGGELMKYKFNIGDYFVTRNGKNGYILELTEFGNNQNAFTLGFLNDNKTVLEYTNNGIYNNDDFVLFEDYFERIGNYDFSNVKISPLSIVSVPMKWEGRDSQLMWDKINEIIRYINKQ
jgi:hypothetical protein